MTPWQVFWIQPSISKLGSLSACRIKSSSALDHALCPFTFILQVAHVQDGSQQLGDLPVLCVGEHEDLHSRADIGVLLAVISAITGGAVTLGRQTGHTLHGTKPGSTLGYQGFP